MRILHKFWKILLNSISIFILKFSFYSIFHALIIFNTLHQFAALKKVLRRQNDSVRWGRNVRRQIKIFHMLVHAPNICIFWKNSENRLKWFSEKINKIDNALANIPEKREKIQTTNTRNEREAIITDLLDIKNKVI